MENQKNNSSRRNFLKQATSLGVGTALPPIHAARNGETMTKNTYPENSTLLSSESETKITLLYTSDIHAQLHTHDEFFWENNKPVYKRRGGMAVLKTMITTLKKKNPSNTIVLDGGDYFHGHAIASKTEGEALIPIFNDMGYDLMLPGNWEVVYKKKKMLFDMGHAHAAKICANMWHQTNDETNGELIYQPYWIKVINGIKIGFIGYTDHLIPKRQSPAYSAGIRFEHAEKNVARYVAHLREVEDCSIVLLVTHMGLAQQVGLGNNPVCTGVDFILGADTHERVRIPIECKYTKVIECGAFGSFLGKLELTVENKKIKSYKYDLLDADPAIYKPDPALAKMIDTLSKPFDTELKKVIGTTTSPLVRYFVLETPMDNLITDAILWKFNPDIALSNGFRFCQPLAIDSKSGKAEITKEFLWNMLPVDSEAKKGIITGSQLWNWLEKELENAFAKNPSKRFGGWFVRFSGMQVNFTINNEMGKRVNWVKIGNQSLDRDKEYSIVACEREGDPNDTLCRIENVKSPSLLGLNMHKVIEEYLAAHPVVSPTLEGRATATDFNSTLLTQLQGTTYQFR